MRHALITFFLFTSLQGFVQNKLPMPFDILQAYEKGTRAMDGKVGPNYWQNSSNYQIVAELMPDLQRLKGSAKITYYNHSPDTILWPTIHTYHDMYRPDAIRGGYYQLASQLVKTEGVTLNKVQVNGQPVRLDRMDESYFNGSQWFIRIKNGLHPGDSALFEIDWEYEIPMGNFTRSGGVNPKRFFIGYWYPEIGVYDDLYGFDRITYDGIAEFYHDQSTYNITLRTPADFLVWGSVPVSNSEEVYDQWMRDRLNELESGRPIQIMGKKELNKSKQSGTIDWKFSSNNLEDFAFGACSECLWRGQKVKIGDKTHYIHVVYPSSRSQFGDVLPSLKSSLEIFDSTFPKYPFPYEQFVVFNGDEFGGGMEFPGMANDAFHDPKDWEDMIGKKLSVEEANLNLTLHEMFHMYFPFLLGINEKRFAWMDEGLASYAEYFLPYTKEIEQKSDNEDLANSRLAPTIIQTYQQKDNDINSYVIGAAAFYSLHALLGDEVFFKGLHTFMDEWKHKHPTPYDLFFTFERVSGQDLTWFWRQWFFDWTYLDLEITSKDDSIYVYNKGGKPVAFEMILTGADGVEQKEIISPKVWEQSNTYRLYRPGTIKASIHIPVSGDAYLNNNHWIKE